MRRGRELAKKERIGKVIENKQGIRKISKGGRGE